MKTINRETLLHIFLGVIAIQSLFLLAYSANFLLAEVPTTIEYSLRVEGAGETEEVSNGITIEGIKNINATITPNYKPEYGELSAVSLVFENTAIDQIELPIVTTDATKNNWTYSLDTSLMPNGNYNLYVKASFGPSYQEESQHYSVKVYNALQITQVNIPTSTLSDDQYFSVLLNQQASAVSFRIMKGPDGIDTTYDALYKYINTGSHKYELNLDTTLLSNGSYIVKVEVTDSAGLKFFENRNITIKNTTTPGTTSPNTTTPGTTTPVDSLQIISLEVPTGTLSGYTTLYAYLNKYIERTNVKFYIIGSSNDIYIARDSFQSDNTSDNKKYYHEFDTKQLPNGTYTIRVEATDNSGTSYKESSIIINNSTMDDQNPASFEITSFGVPAVLSGLQQHIWISTNKQAVVKFHIIGINNTNINEIIDGTYSNNFSNYYTDIDTTVLTNGLYKIKIEATANDGEKVIKELDVNVSNDELNNVNVSNIDPIDSTNLEITSFNVPEKALFGVHRLYIKLNKNIPRENIYFNLIGGINNINKRFQTFHSNDFYGSEYYAEIDTKNYSNGTYTIKAEINDDGKIRTETRTVSIYNQQPSITDSETSFMSECEQKGITIKEYCDKYMNIAYECRQNDITNFQDCANYLKDLYLDPECVKQGITTHKACNDILFTKTAPIECQNDSSMTREQCDNMIGINYFIPQECKNENISDPKSCDEFMMQHHIPFECEQKGTTDKQECDNLMRDSYHEFENMSYMTSPNVIDSMSFSEDELPFECEQKGITSFDMCKEYIISVNLPKECQDAGVKTEDECEKIMFKNYAPEECVNAGISSPDECENFMFKLTAPEDCKEAGILNPRACEKFMFDKYGSMENIPADKFPYECVNANATTIEQCEEIMTKRYLPKECKLEGFDNERDCEIFLQKKNMPKECQDAGVSTRSGCDKIMFKIFGPPECKLAGIENEIECQEFLLNKYFQNVRCDNLDDWQCKNSIKNRHLGNIVSVQNKFKNIRERQIEITGKSIKVSELEDDIIGEENSVSFSKKDLGLKIMSAQESLVLTDEDELIQTSPIVIMIDRDGDGLPDDMEQRIGTDPYRIDSDGDGFDDLSEIKNGYNPLGEGKLENQLVGIEKAIIENQLLEHPRTIEENNENLTIKKPSNIKDDKGNETKGYILSGTSIPNSIATIYIYSDLPILVTVRTDKYGNWIYNLEESLIDGEHEAYVVINDNTGKVISKSNPVSFFIKEAKAVSAKNFISNTNAASSETTKKSDNLLKYYLYAAIIIILAGLTIFIFMLRNRKKNIEVK